MPDSAPPAPIPVRIAPPPAGYGAATPVRQTGATGLATAALVLGIVAVPIDVLFVPTILAVVFGSVALGQATPARGRAIAGIVLGILAIGVQAAIAIPVYLGVQNEARAARLESSIAQDSTDGGFGLSAIDCPATIENPGDLITCSAQSSSAGRVDVLVTITDAHGGYRYRIAPATSAG